MDVCMDCGLCYRLEEREPPLGRYTAFVVSGNKAGCSLKRDVTSSLSVAHLKTKQGKSTL